MGNLRIDDYKPKNSSLSYRERNSSNSRNRVLFQFKFFRPNHSEEVVYVSIKADLEYYQLVHQEEELKEMLFKNKTTLFLHSKI